MCGVPARTVLEDNRAFDAIRIATRTIAVLDRDHPTRFGLNREKGFADRAGCFGDVRVIVVPWSS